MGSRSGSNKPESIKNNFLRKDTAKAINFDCI